MSTPTQVLVVGAGPTGLALACHLLRLGVAVRIVDKKSGFSTTSKAIGLQYRVSEILACMGIVDRFLAAGSTPTVVNIHAGERRLVQLKFDASKTVSGRDAFRPQGIVIPQSQTEQILGEVLVERGGHIEWGTEYLDFEDDSTHVRSRLRANKKEETITSNWLVSCEGAHSIIRQQAGIAFSGKTYPLAFFLADVEIEGPLAHGENYVWMHAQGSFAALPLPRLRTWRLFVDVTKSPELLSREVSLDVIRQVMLERVGQKCGITISNPTWVSDFRIHCRMVNRYRTGRVFVAGDAAHVHSPTGGQGIVTGIQDVTNLAWKLGRVIAGAPEELLNTYEEERLPKAAEVLRETDRTTRLMLAPDPLTRILRDFVMLPILRSRAVQRRLFAKLAQLHVNYRGSSLSSHDDASRRFFSTVLEAGDRAPDVAFRDLRDGKTVTLFQLLQPMRPIALLGRALVPDIEGERQAKALLSEAGIQSFVLYDQFSNASENDYDLSDCHGDFRRLYGMTGSFVCLVRPDDHIGLFLRPLVEDKLRTYLSKLGFAVH